MITLGALNAFRPAMAWSDNTKLNVDGQGAVGNAGNYGGFLSARNREQTERDANNAVRTELLKALARTFDIKMTDRPVNGTHFSQRFMGRLELLLDADRAAGKDVGVEELYSTSKLVHEVFFGRNPGLRDQIVAFLKRPDVLEDNIHDPQQLAFAACHFEHIVRDEEGNDIPSAKEHVLANLGTPQLHPIYVQSAGELDTTTLKAFAIGVLQRQ